MERGTPTAEHMAAPYDLINSLFGGKDVFYTEEGPEELKEKGATTWV